MVCLQFTAQIAAYMYTRNVHLYLILAAINWSQSVHVQSGGGGANVYIEVGGPDSV